MYRHFALVTVLLTASIAMFADGENREAAAAQIEDRPEPQPTRPDAVLQPPAPRENRDTASRRARFVDSNGFNGFDPSFGAPMDKPMGSLATYARRLAPEIAQAGYSDTYLASLSAEERDLLSDGLEQEGMLSPAERERKTAALVAASEARSGTSPANY
jgi:hypothetical protein